VEAEQRAVQSRFKIDDLSSTVFTGQSERIRTGYLEVRNAVNCMKHGGYLSGSILTGGPPQTPRTRSSSFRRFGHRSLDDDGFVVEASEVIAERQ
jgi:hypothetical protein